MARLSLSSYWLSGRALSSDWMARISLSSYWLSGRALLCVPADVDPVLQDDLLHDHLHDLQEHARHHAPGQLIVLDSPFNC